MSEIIFSIWDSFQVWVGLGSHLGCNTNLGCAVWCTIGVRTMFALDSGFVWELAHEGGFSEGLWEFTLQDTEPYLCFYL